MLLLTPNWPARRLAALIVCRTSGIVNRKKPTPAPWRLTENVYNSAGFRVEKETSLPMDSYFGGESAKAFLGVPSPIGRCTLTVTDMTQPGGCQAGWASVALGRCGVGVTDAFSNP